MSNNGATVSEQASAAESFRERVARHVDGVSAPSNFEAMCAAIERRLGPPKCRECDGKGFRSPGTERLQAFKDRIANMQSECARMTKDSFAPAKDEGDIDRAVADQQHRNKLALNVQRIQRNMFNERWEFKQQFRCNACEGSGLGRRAGSGAPLRPDALFTTVVCPECRGSDDREHVRLMQAHRGTSAGKLTPSTETEFHPAGSTCPLCKGDAFVVPLTARPTLKTADVPDDVDEGQLGRQRRRRARPRAPESPMELIESLQETEPLVAVATVVLLGAHGREWAQHASGWGARFAIWPLVTGGQQLVLEATSSSAEPDWYRRQLDIIRLERLAALENPGAVRVAALVGITDGQARKLEAKVEAAIERGEAA